MNGDQGVWVWLLRDEEVGADEIWGAMKKGVRRYWPSAGLLDDVEDKQP